MSTLITGQTWGDNVDSVRAYLLREAEQPFGVLRPKLGATWREFGASLERVSDAQAQFIPASGEGEDAWGIAEVLRHVASIQPIMEQRVRLLGTGQSADGIARTHSGYLAHVDTRRITDLLAALDQSYADLVDAIATIDGRERLDTLAAHRRFGELNCRGWIAMHTLHLQDHARQIGRIKRMNGYPAG